MPHLYKVLMLMHSVLCRCELLLCRPCPQEFKSSGNNIVIKYRNEGWLDGQKEGTWVMWSDIFFAASGQSDLCSGLPTTTFHDFPDTEILIRVSDHIVQLHSLSGSTGNTPPSPHLDAGTNCLSLEPRQGGDECNRMGAVQRGVGRGES